MIGLIEGQDPTFARLLCGYRANGKPSTSDNHDANSVRWGHAMFDALSVDPASTETPKIGTALESAIATALAAERPDLQIQPSTLATSFDQYRHLLHLKRYFNEVQDDYDRIEKATIEADRLESSRAAAALRRRLKTIRAHSAINRDLLAQLKEDLPEESMLKIDVAISSLKREGRLLIGLSSKWSLRTDRAQDCISQGSKLVSQRRGHMPHYAVVTMEPRPSMLRLLADGSGSLDCVYHVAFNALLRAADDLDKQNIKTMPQQITLLRRMIKQGRIRPFSALAEEVSMLP